MRGGIESEKGKEGKRMNSVLISIKPEWCKLIIYGDKTIEVRKRKPEQVAFPFTAYVYATFGGENWFSYGKQKSGRVIGKFVCDDIKRYDIPYPAWNRETDPDLIERSCVSYSQLHRYAGDQGYVYGWQIRDFENWDTPLPIWYFIDSKGNRFRRAPQSWAYASRLL